MRKSPQALVCASSILLLIASLVLGWFDRDQLVYRWITFSLWAVGISTLIPVLVCLSRDTDTSRQSATFSRFLKLASIVIILAAIISRFAYLESYPFITTGDEVRDGGLRGYEIYAGKLRNIFGYDWSQGLLSATLCSFAYSIFGPSVLSYRVPGAIISIGTLLTVLLIGRSLAGARAATIGAFVLLFNWSELHFARTEPLIGLSELMVLPVTAAAVFCIQKPSAYRVALLAALTGISLNLHASLKPLLGAMCIAAFLGVLFKSIKQENKATYFFRTLPIYGGIALVVILLAFGPRAYYTTWETFSNSRRVRGDFSLSALRWDYWQSLRFLIDRSVIYHFGSNEHVIFPLVTVRILAGVGLFVVIVRSLFGKLQLGGLAVAAAVLLIPLTNAALTESPNLDHRIMPVVVVFSLLAGIGGDAILSINRIPYLHRTIGIMCATLVAAFSVQGSSQLIAYFTKEPSSARFHKDDAPFHYWLMHTVYAIKDPENDLISQEHEHNREVCLEARADFIEPINLAHFRELLDYFLPDIRIDTSINERLSDEVRTIVVTQGACKPPGQESSYKKVIPVCEVRQRFLCPPEGSARILVQ